MATILSIIAPEGYQDIEYGDSKAALEEAGHKVITASSESIAHDKWGGTTIVDLLLSEVNPEDYNAVAFIGGPGSRVYFHDATAHQIAKAFYESGKVTAGICAAPSILANAGLLEGKTATCWPSEAENLKNHGANYTGSPVEQDGLIITGSGPDSAKAFGQKIAQNIEKV